jgi:acyl-ACP thioesterase
MNRSAEAGVGRPMIEMVPIPTRGRTFVRTRTVSLGDVNPYGRIRLDGLARVIQDIATADAADALSGSAYAYVLRRLVFSIKQTPEIGERLTLTTFCGGTARSWAERRTSVVGDRGALVETSGIWVPIDSTGRPSRLPEDFLAAYAEAAAGRRVEARLTHGRPPESAVEGRWPLRYTDLDTLGHVNNAAHWCALEDRLAGRRVLHAEIEFVDGLLLDEPCSVLTVDRPDGVDSWLCAEGHVRSSQRVWLRM